MTYGLIVGGGRKPDIKWLRDAFNQASYVIAADRGYDHFASAGLEPDEIVGDLDSVSQESLVKIHDSGIPVFRYPPEKDVTDLTIAIERMVEKGVDTLWIAGSTGSRVDHSLSAILALHGYLSKGLQVKLIDDKNALALVSGTINIEKGLYTYLSVLPADVSGATVSLVGCKYPLSHKKIAFGSSLGVSNEIVDDRAHVTVHEGLVYLIQSTD